MADNKDRKLNLIYLDHICIAVVLVPANSTDAFMKQKEIVLFVLRSQGPRCQDDIVTSDKACPHDSKRRPR